MKLVLFNDNRPGLLKDDGVVDLREATHPLGASNGQSRRKLPCTTYSATWLAWMFRCGCLPARVPALLGTMLKCPFPLK